MKHYVDIEVLREFDEKISSDLIKKSNSQAFKAGDIISITEKIDGSNASIELVNKKLLAFSRKQELDCFNTLDGFWNFVQNLDPVNFYDSENLVIFGEWNRKNKIIYDAEYVHKWYVYSIYDKVNEVWMNQSFVKDYCSKHNLIYVHELYYGPFISWEHCRTFLHSPAYGDRQEGIVIRNLSALERKDYYPHILKIVNDDFKESMKVKVKVVDEEKEAARIVASQLMESIVTRNRIEKMLLKLRDEQILPEELTPKDMTIVAKNLPKRIFDDCMKEEPEIMQKCGEFAGKLCGNLTMKIAKEIILK